jgi:tartrate-resistant acid phosphatase type 5
MAMYKPEFVLALGDNFYKDGVEDVDSKRFRDTFDDVYTGSSLQVPWYLIAGNHDHKGSVESQIAYTNQSTRWTFPDYWYSFTKQFSTPSGDKVSVQFVMIDTVLLSGSLNDDDDDGPNSDIDMEIASAQWDWIHSTLKSSVADWVFVAGHYPVWSVGNHGPTADLVHELDPLMRQYNVSAYFCGHEHNVEFLRGSIDYIVTGAGHGVEYSMKHKSALPSSVNLRFFYPFDDNFGESDGMFTYMTVLDGYRMNTTYIDADGDIVAQYTTLNKRLKTKK